MNRIRVAVIVVVVVTGCRGTGGALTDGSAAQPSHPTMDRCKRGFALAALIFIETELSGHLEKQEAREEKEIQEDRELIKRGEQPFYHEDEAAIRNHEFELNWARKEPRGLARLWKAQSEGVNDENKVSDTSEQTNPTKPFEPLTIEQIYHGGSADSQEVPNVPTIPWAYEGVGSRFSVNVGP
jgi:hypothetical protein